jgi:hypothetical protein
MQTVVGFGVNGRINRVLTLSLDYSAGKIGGQRIDFFNSYFINEYNSLDAVLKWDLMEQFIADRESRLHASLYAGLGHMRFSAQAFDLTTNERVRFTNSDASARNPLFLRWGPPKGSPAIKRTNERNIPVGLAFNYIVTPAWRLGLDYRFYFVRTDKLDATSGMSLENPEEATSYSDTPMDKFSALSLTLTYRFSRSGGQSRSKRTYF